MPVYSSDTIVAAATPPGKGGIGIVRISGPDAELIGEQMLGAVPEARHATNVIIADFFGNELDHGIALFFPGTASFTGEPVLELHGHGGPVVMQSIIDAAVSHGARRAAPGEFSKRAFLNGKLDLAQAEAIVDLIESGTSQAARGALRSLSGAFSAAVTSLQQRLLNLRMHVEAAIDFPEEEIDFLSDDALLKKIDECAAAFTELQKQTSIGRMLRDGLQLVIVGQPNAGKSSLLNQLSGQDAAIVTEIAGTTRDILRERIEIDGLSVELVDTAGIRENPDRIEAEGISRARAALKKADGVLWIQDANIEYAADLEEKFPPDIPVIILRNKIDLTGDEPGPVPEFPHVLNISARTGAGVAELRDAIRELAGYRDLGEGAFTARRRHVEAVTRALEHFERGREALSNHRAGELLAEDLRESHKALGEITGAITSDDLLGKIFSSFCIGK